MLHIKTIKKFLLDLLFPIDCLGCGQEGIWLCENCQGKISLNKKLPCPFCSADTNGAVCQNCHNKSQLDGLLVATSYENPITQTLIQALKYQYITDIAQLLARILTNFLNGFDNNNQPAILQGQENTILMPMPLHKKRLLERGFNQSELLANLLKDNFSFSYNPHLLTRTRYTEAQAKLSRKDRLENLKNAFALEKNFDLSGKNVIIIDDVATTLATLEECAKVLKQANCRQVWGLVVARGG